MKSFPLTSGNALTRSVLLPDKLLSARVFPDPQSQRSGAEPPGGLAFPLAGCIVGKPDASKPWTPGGGGARGELDEETKKNQNIINIVREGQISLLVGGGITATSTISTHIL